MLLYGPSPYRHTKRDQNIYTLIAIPHVMQASPFRHTKSDQNIYTFNAIAHVMQAFADRPLSAVGLDKYVLLRSRSERSLPQVSGVMPFDLKRHPSAKSKITQVYSFGLRVFGSALETCLFMRLNSGIGSSYSL